MDLYTLLGQFKDGEIDKQKVIDAIDESKSGMVPRSRLNDKNTEIEELKKRFLNVINKLSNCKTLLKMIARFKRTRRIKESKFRVGDKV